MKRHWYSVEISYQSKSGRRMFSKDIEVGLVCQSDILKKRLLKKQIAPRVVGRKEVKPYLCNGSVEIRVLAYLGKFSGGPNLREFTERKIGDIMMPYFVYAVMKG